MNSHRNKRGRSWAAILIVTPLLLSACGSGSEDISADQQVQPADDPGRLSEASSPAATGDARAALEDYFRSREIGTPGAFTPWYETIRDLLPNVQFRTAAGPRSVAQTAVLGKIVDITPGVGFTFDDSDEPQSVRVAFDDPNAKWVTAHLQVSVIEQLVGEPTTSDRISVQLPLNKASDLEKIRPGFQQMEQLVLFLDEPKLNEGDRAAEYSIVRNGELFAEVDSGRLSLPWTQTIDPNQARKYLGELTTLEALRAAAKEPNKVRELPAGARDVTA